MNISDEEFIELCNSAVSMRSVAEKLNIPFSSFKRRALQLNCYKTNQSGKGLNKNPFYKWSIDSLLNNEHYIGTSHLRERLIKAGLKKEQCECCKLSEWMGKKIPLQLHHIDGNDRNNNLDNLQILCPNCHSQTDNWCSKNKKRSVAQLAEASDLESEKCGFDSLSTDMSVAKI